MNTEALIQGILEGVQLGQTIAYAAIWKVITDFLADHLIATLIILGSLFIMAIIRAISGRWDMLGKFLYWFLFLGTLLAVTATFGPEIFASNYVKVGTLILGAIVYFAVGEILDRTGLMRGH
jgi:hypothetical protein